MRGRKEGVESSDGREFDVEGCMGQEGRVRAVSQGRYERKGGKEAKGKERIKVRGYEMCISDSKRNENYKYGTRYIQTMQPP